MQNNFVTNLHILAALAEKEYESKVSERGHSWETIYTSFEYLEYANSHLKVAGEAYVGAMPKWIVKSNIVKTLVYLNMALARLE